MEMCFVWCDDHCNVVLKNIQHVFTKLHSLDRVMRKDFLHNRNFIRMKHEILFQDGSKACTRDFMCLVVTSHWTSRTPFDGHLNTILIFGCYNYWNTCGRFLGRALPCWQKFSNKVISLKLWQMSQYFLRWLVCKILLP